MVRYRIPGGLTDALGYLRSVDEIPDEVADVSAGSSTGRNCVVETRTGEVVIALDDVQAAKEVPPPPPRRG